WEVLCTPLNVKNAVGRSATYRGEYAEPTVDQVQVVPVRIDRVRHSRLWQAAVGEDARPGGKVGLAVGVEPYLGEGLVVQGERKWQRDGCDRIIPVIADIYRDWNDAAPDMTDRVYAAGRCWRWCRRGCGCSRCC